MADLDEGAIRERLDQLEQASITNQPISTLAILAAASAADVRPLLDALAASRRRAAELQRRITAALRRLDQAEGDLAARAVLPYHLRLTLGSCRDGAINGERLAEAVQQAPGQPADVWLDAGLINQMTIPGKGA